MGRLAVHKLATAIVLVTKEEGVLFGHTFAINWKDLIKNTMYIEDTKVSVSDCPNTTFINKQHGTRVILSNLRRKTWLRKDFRNLARTINTLISPFEKNKDNFSVELVLPEEQAEPLETQIPILSSSKINLEASAPTKETLAFPR